MAFIYYVTEKYEIENFQNALLKWLEWPYPMSFKNKDGIGLLRPFQQKQWTHTLLDKCPKKIKRAQTNPNNYAIILIATFMRIQNWGKMESICWWCYLLPQFLEFMSSNIHFKTSSIFETCCKVAWRCPCVLPIPRNEGVGSTHVTLFVGTANLRTE